MQIVSLDGWKLLALMLAGGIFALAGLWLMFRPQPAGEANRFEFLGVKIQASSAGLLVFLIGAAFLTMPIFVPERTGSPGAVAPHPGRRQRRTGPCPCSPAPTRHGPRGRA